ncbi:glycerol-3-phosphate dehydrogenase/oxidase [Pandoraea sp.]|uniref:glycerol-3-phosphate dehydrogenase/oxidase n=1 Tax=Pandoraea sp. TaxID=1883445 RepID=UPI00120E9AD1|nr:glycerol-3-phosphate dehydrogenase/oxidase [Pandoraea sp.]TAL56481.1 MAG: glycerol-3-phosphate dehydrogenase/oxidase [Pandoraea sp.]TAM15300.1 MAG: glycerol-3-phosphate dehydrogenase/oxidase [Pandoraea sp.]
MKLDVSPENPTAPAQLRGEPLPHEAARDAGLARLRAERQWDVIVIGGGATGLGCAVDAASRGFSTVLVEARTIGSGTSSRSSKLVHGGVRYLAQGNIKLVREALHERATLLHIAPDICHALPFVIPCYRWFEQPFYWAGMKIYDALAGRRRLAPARWLSRRATLARVPSLKTEGLRGGVLYYDGQFDDLRLARALANTLHELGGVALEHMSVTGVPLRPDGRAQGIEVRAEDNGEVYALSGKCVINATGVWVDTIRRLADPGAEALVSPSQGTHLLLDASFWPGGHALLIPNTADGRVLFVLPWNGKTLIGTTDVPREDTPFEPQPRDEEIDFLLQTAGQYLSRQPGRGDILAHFTGLRPLVRADSSSTAELSREHLIRVERDGMITVTGGKWTTYRRMAQDTLDTAIRIGQLPPAPCRTERLKLAGAS